MYRPHRQSLLLAIVAFFMVLALAPNLTAAQDEQI